MNLNVSPDDLTRGEEDPLLKYKEAATFLRKSPQTLANLRVLGAGPAREGTGYRLSALVRWRMEQEEKRRRRKAERQQARENANQPSLFDNL